MLDTEEEASIQTNQEEKSSEEQQLDIIIATGNETLVIDWLNKYFIFAANNSELVFKKAFENKLDKVIESLLDTLDINKEDLIRWAVDVGNIKRVQKFTNFTNFVTSPGHLKISEYQEHLQNWNLEPIFLDKILCLMGTNWQDNFSRERYLNMLLRRTFLDDEYKKLILRFISNLSPVAINIREHKTKNTALHEALYAVSMYKDNQDEESMHNAEEIIEALLRHGANPLIENNAKIAPNDFVYFEDNRKLCEQWQAEGRKTVISSSAASVNSTQGEEEDAIETPTLIHQAPKLPKKKMLKKKSNRSQLTILTLAGLSIGAAVFYLGYKLLKKNNTKAIARLK